MFHNRTTITMTIRLGPCLSTQQHYSTAYLRIPQTGGGQTVASGARVQGGEIPGDEVQRGSGRARGISSGAVSRDRDDVVTHTYTHVHTYTHTHKIRAGRRGDARQRGHRRASATGRRTVCHDDGRPVRLAARQARNHARQVAQYVAERAARYRPNIARSWTRHGGGGGGGGRAALRPLHTAAQGQRTRVTRTFGYSTRT